MLNRTMATIIDQHVALDEAFVPSTQRLRIRRSNFRIPSNIQSKESTLQVVYDVLCNSPFFRAFQVTADVPEIYMQEFWATAKLHQHSIRFKMDTKKSVLDLKAFREMLHISPRIPSQSFAELPFEEEILDFLRDDVLFFTIKVVSRHQTTQQYGAILPIELTTEDIRNSKAYKEYYACATREAAPKPKASAKKKKGDFASSTTPPTPTPTTNVVAAPRLSATAKGKQPARATTPTEPTDVERIEAEQLKIVLDEDVDEQTKGREESEGGKTDESDDGSDDGNDDNNDETVKAGSDKDDYDNDDEEELAKNDDVDTESCKGGDEVSKSEGESDEEETRQEEEESFDPIPRTPEGNELYRDVDINQGRGLQVTQNIEDSYVTLTPVHLDGPQESLSMSSFMTSMLNPISDAGVESIFTTASSPIVSLQSPTPIRTPSTIATINTSRDAPIHPTTIPSIILKNLPTFNSGFRFDKILRSLETTFSEYRQTNPFVDAVSATPDEQRNIYKALVEAYDADKAILNTYGESTILKQRQEDDDQEGPSAGSDRGSKIQREGGEHASASTPSETATGKEPVQTTCQMEEPSHSVFETGADDQPMVQTSQHPKWFSHPKRPPSPDRDWNKTLPAAQGDAQSWISVLARQTDACSSFNELLDTPIDFSKFIMNRLNPSPLIPNNRGRRVIPFDHFINNDLEYLRGGDSSRKYTTSVTKTKAADYGHIKWIEDLVPLNWESALDVYSKRRIITVTKLKIVEWPNYKHLDWISVPRDDDKIYKFKEGDFKRLRLQDIEDMLLLLVQGKLSNLTVEERFAFNVSLRIDGTLNDVRNAIDDHLKGIRMQYLPTIIWRRGDKDRAAAMIQAIEKMLKTRRIMRSLEKFVGRRLYKGDFCILQRTI
uniref:Uncharacterized protein n=2 Tax=Tanacetum cinerariifolium TaxID=118510 RepID=A0A699IQI1_TANCI|nr:hypothetical protein [Tanacetum cinerariifolium]